MNSGSTSLVDELFPDYPTPPEVAATLHISEEQVEQLANQGRLPYLDGGTRRRFFPWGVERLALTKRKQYGTGV